MAKVDTKTGKVVLSEKEIRKEICSYLRATGVAWWWNLQGLGCYRGLSDLSGVYRGKHFYIEVKTLRGKLSEHQKNFKRMVEEESEDYCLAHSFEEFEEWWLEFIKTGKEEA